MDEKSKIILKLKFPNKGISKNKFSLGSQCKIRRLPKATRTSFQITVLLEEYKISVGFDNIASNIIPSFVPISISWVVISLSLN